MSFRLSYWIQIIFSQAVQFSKIILVKIGTRIFFRKKKPKPPPLPRISNGPCLTHNCQINNSTNCQQGIIFTISETFSKSEDSLQRVRLHGHSICHVVLLHKNKICKNTELKNFLFVIIMN